MSAAPTQIDALVADAKASLLLKISNPTRRRASKSFNDIRSSADECFSTFSLTGCGVGVGVR
ncbi:MAG: hypothetical protein ACRDSZ_01065 [Pseudonocardiaceae bacterium]